MGFGEDRDMLQFTVTHLSQAYQSEHGLIRSILVHPTRAESTHFSLRPDQHVLRYYIPEGHSTGRVTWYRITVSYVQRNLHKLHGAAGFRFNLPCSSYNRGRSRGFLFNSCLVCASNGFSSLAAPLFVRYRSIRPQDHKSARMGLYKRLGPS